MPTKQQMVTGERTWESRAVRGSWLMVRFLIWVKVSSGEFPNGNRIRVCTGMCVSSLMMNVYLSHIISRNLIYSINGEDNLLTESTETLLKLLYVFLKSKIYLVALFVIVNSYLNI